jgi:hypothetical protein
VTTGYNDATAATTETSSDWLASAVPSPRHLWRYLEGEAVRVLAGDAVMFRADRGHRYANESDIMVHCITVVSMPALGPEAGSAPG